MNFNNQTEKVVGNVELKKLGMTCFTIFLLLFWMIQRSNKIIKKVWLDFQQFEPFSVSHNK